MLFLGLDIGTSAVKAIVVDAHQNVVGKQAAPLSVQTPQPGWSEQDPESWWLAALSALGALRRELGPAWTGVRAIGLSGQMHGAVVLGREKTVLRPAILWNDGRSVAECAELAAHMPDLGALAGVPAMPGFTAPKLLWLRRHEPDVFRKVAHVLLPKDYVRLRLTGDLATDACDAAGTLWLDQAGRKWSPDLLAASGMTAAQMPRLLEGVEASGVLRPDIAAELGLPTGVIVAAGAGDAAAGAVGIGAVDEGDAFLSLGTSGQLFMATQTYRPRPERYVHAFCHALPGRWFQMAALLNGASCIAWIARQLGETDIAALLARVERKAPAPSGLTFLPYLTGERTPHNDPAARGAFIGLGPATTPEAMVRAVLEGVAFSCVDARDCLTAAGSVISHIGLIGGGSQSRFWATILASALELPLHRYKGGETGPAFGAARLGRLALTREAPADICAKPEVLDMIVPDPALSSLYRDSVTHFRDLYQRLKGAFEPPALSPDYAG
jgi:xylulokinase